MLIVNFNKNQYKIHTSYSVKVTVSKRAMHKIVIRALSKPSTSNTCLGGRRLASTQIQKPDVTKMSNEECQMNPIIGSKGIQHNGISMFICRKPKCSDNLNCPKPCADIKEVRSIAHTTHSDNIPNGYKISDTDLNNNPIAQYAVMYPENKRPIVTEPESTKDEQRTQNMKSNKEMMTNLNIYKKMFDDTHSE